MNSKIDFTATPRKRISFFTLLEVMISMGVFAILMLALMQFFVSAQAVVERTGSKAEFYDNSRIAMDLLANDLICVFYKSEYDGNLYTFMYYDTSDKTKIKFATMRPDGLAEVYYSWDSATLKLSLTTLKESVDFSTYSGAWVTRPNSSTPHAWVSSLDSATTKTVEIADNVVKFSIVLKKNSSSTGDSVPAADLKIPILAEINLAVISDDARKKLETMGITTSTLSAKYSDDSSLTDAQKDILKAGTQEFKRIILIERGQ